MPWLSSSGALCCAIDARPLGMDVRALPQPVSILETMGRQVGWLAAASVAVKRNDREAPHLVYLPEVPFEMDEFISDLDTVLRRRDWAIVVVSEGLKDKAWAARVSECRSGAGGYAFHRPLPGGLGVILQSSRAQVEDSLPR